KNNALNPALSTRLRELAYEDLLRNPANDAEGIRNVWFAIPAEDRLKSYVALRGAHAFNLRGLHEGARTIVEKSLAQEWDERLLRPYRAAAAEQGSPALVAQIERCEEWCRQQPGEPELE